MASATVWRLILAVAIAMTVMVIALNQSDLLTYPSWTLLFRTFLASPFLISILAAILLVRIRSRVRVADVVLGGTGFGGVVISAVLVVLTMPFDSLYPAFAGAACFLFTITLLTITAVRADSDRRLVRSLFATPVVAFSVVGIQLFWFFIHLRAH